jgi:hypothetical protein
MARRWRERVLIGGVVSRLSPQVRYETTERYETTSEKFDLTISEKIISSTISSDI